MANAPNTYRNGLGEEWPWWVQVTGDGLIELGDMAFDFALGDGWYAQDKEFTQPELHAAAHRLHAEILRRASADELAALRARVAELTLERDGLSEMVAELEAERAALTKSVGDELLRLGESGERIRADERARTESDIADFARCAGDDNLADHIEKSDYPKLPR